MELVMLGTGHALVTRCFSTCFLLREGDRAFLVDSGGGNGLLTQLAKTGTDLSCISDVFISHIHLDHMLGVFWLLRCLAHRARKGLAKPLRLYGNSHVLDTLWQITKLLLPKAMPCLTELVHTISLEETSSQEILGRTVHFFALCAKHTPQHGFRLNLTCDQTFVFLGDIPFSEPLLPHLKGCTWLMHEAFCLEEDADRFHPHAIEHSTVLDAASLAQRLHIPHCILTHADDSDLEHRSERFLREAQSVYHGDIHIPYDLEHIRLI